MNYENQSGELNLNFQKELLYFKDDILKDLKSFESKLSSKYNDIQQSVETKLKNYDEKIEVLTEKMSNISITSNQNKILEEKIENINKFKDTIKDQVLTNEIKLDSTYKDLQNAIFKYFLTQEAQTFAIPLSAHHKPSSNMGCLRPMGQSQY